MSDNGPRWSLRSALISVSDLDQSTEFYTDVMNLREVLSKDRVAVLGSDATGSFTLFLREANRYAVVSGQQALGLRTLSCDVGSFAELDRVEKRLRAHDLFRDRQSVAGTGALEMVRGHDPDRLPLSFLAHENGMEMTIDAYQRAVETMYVVDL